MAGTMRLLIFGSTGQLAREIAAMSLERGILTKCIGRDQADITDGLQIERAIERAQPTCVINATAYTTVDKAESDADAAFAVNRDGPAFLAEACVRRHLPLIHVSTDYVFDGSKSSAYVETDPVGPIGVYGVSKEAGERAIRERLQQHIIVRTAWLYSQYGQNFLKTMLRLATSRSEWGVVSDQIGMPTAAADLAAAVLVAAADASDARPVWGTYHFAGGEEATWHQFAMEIIAEQSKYTNLKPVVSAITSDQYPTAARRPMNSRLDSGLFAATFGLTAVPRQRRVASIVKALLQQSARVPA